MFQEVTLKSVLIDITSSVMSFAIVFGLFATWVA